MVLRDDAPKRRARRRAVLVFHRGWLQTTGFFSYRKFLTTGGSRKPNI